MPSREVIAAGPGRTVTTGNSRIELDLASQVLAIGAPKDVGWGQNGEVEAPLSATLGALDLSGPVSAAVLAQKAKLFDDGLHAAVDVAAQDGEHT